MCVPAIAAAAPALMSSLGTVSTVMSVGSGLLGAYAAVQNGNAAAAAAKASAAQQSEAARQAIEQGQQESDQAQRRAAAVMAGNQIAAAANGVDLSSASALDVLDDSRTAAAEDAFAIRENARRVASGYAQGAANSLAEARSAKSRGFFEATSTLLTTGARVGERFSWMAGRERDPLRAAMRGAGVY